MLEAQPIEEKKGEAQTISKYLRSLYGNGVANKKDVMKHLRRRLYDDPKVEEIYRKLKEIHGNSGICTEQWKEGSFAFKCYNCEGDPTCAICAKCFFASNHRNHVYRLTHTSGGCCDCGDTSWNIKGACFDHRGMEEQHLVDKCILKEDVKNRMKEDLENLVGSLFKEIILKDGYFLSLANAQYIEYALEFFKDLGITSYLFRQIICNVLTGAKIDYLINLHYSFYTAVQRVLYSLYLSLFVHPYFKQRFAFKLAKYYSLVVRVVDSKSYNDNNYLNGLTVQVLTVPEIAYTLVVNNFLNDLIKLIEEFCIYNPTTRCIMFKNLLRSDIEVIIRICVDMKYLLYHNDVIKVLLFNKYIIRKILHLLSLLHRMNSQMRYTKAHIIYEDLSSSYAITIENYLLRVFEPLANFCKREANANFRNLFLLYQLTIESICSLNLFPFSGDSSSDVDTVRPKRRIKRDRPFFRVKKCILSASHRVGPQTDAPAGMPSTATDNVTNDPTNHSTNDATNGATNDTTNDATNDQTKAKQEQPPRRVKHLRSMHSPLVRFFVMILNFDVVKKCIDDVYWYKYIYLRGLRRKKDKTGNSSYTPPRSEAERTHIVRAFLKDFYSVEQTPPETLTKRKDLQQRYEDDGNKIKMRIFHRKPFLNDLQEVKNEKTKAYLEEMKDLEDRYFKWVIQTIDSKEKEEDDKILYRKNIQEKEVKVKCKNDLIEKKIKKKDIEFNEFLEINFQQNRSDIYLNPLYIDLYMRDVFEFLNLFNLKLLKYILYVNVHVLTFIYEIKYGYWVRNGPQMTFQVNEYETSFFFQSDLIGIQFAMIMMNLLPLYEKQTVKIDKGTKTMMRKLFSQYIGSDGRVADDSVLHGFVSGTDSSSKEELTKPGEPFVCGHIERTMEQGGNQPGGICNDIAHHDEDLPTEEQSLIYGKRQPQGGEKKEESSAVCGDDTAECTYRRQSDLTKVVNEKQRIDFDSVYSFLGSYALQRAGEESSVVVKEADGNNPSNGAPRKQKWNDYVKQFMQEKISNPFVILYQLIFKTFRLNLNVKNEQDIYMEVQIHHMKVVHRIFEDIYTGKLSIDSRRINHVFFFQLFYDLLVRLFNELYYFEFSNIPRKTSQEKYKKRGKYYVKKILIQLLASKDFQYFQLEDEFPKQFRHHPSFYELTNKYGYTTHMPRSNVNLIKLNKSAWFLYDAFWPIANYKDFQSANEKCIKEEKASYIGCSRQEDNEYMNFSFVKVQNLLFYAFKRSCLVPMLITIFVVNEDFQRRAEAARGDESDQGGTDRGAVATVDGSAEAATPQRNEPTDVNVAANAQANGALNEGENGEDAPNGDNDNNGDNDDNADSEEFPPGAFVLNEVDLYNLLSQGEGNGTGEEEQGSGEGEDEEAQATFQGGASPEEASPGGEENGVTSTNPQENNPPTDSNTSTTRRNNNTYIIVDDNGENETLFAEILISRNLHNSINMEIVNVTDSHVGEGQTNRTYRQLNAEGLSEIISDIISENNMINDVIVESILENRSGIRYLNQGRDQEGRNVDDNISVEDYTSNEELNITPVEAMNPLQLNLSGGRRDSDRNGRPPGRSFPSTPSNSSLNSTIDIFIKLIKLLSIIMDAAHPFKYLNGFYYSNCTSLGSHSDDQSDGYSDDHSDDLLDDHLDDQAGTEDNCEKRFEQSSDVLNEGHTPEGANPDEENPTLLEGAKEMETKSAPYGQVATRVSSKGANPNTEQMLIFDEIHVLKRERRGKRRTGEDTPSSGVVGCASGSCDACGAPPVGNESNSQTEQKTEKKRTYALNKAAVHNLIRSMSNVNSNEDKCFQKVRNTIITRMKELLSENYDCKNVSSGNQFIEVAKQRQQDLLKMMQDQQLKFSQFLEEELDSDEDILEEAGGALTDQVAGEETSEVTSGPSAVTDVTAVTAAAKKEEARSARKEKKPDDPDDVANCEYEKSKEKNCICVLCKEGMTRNNLLAYICFASHSNLLKKIIKKNKVAFPCKHPAIYTCGHFIHMTCLHNTKIFPSRNAQSQTSSPTKYEFTCPLCRSIANCFVVYIPKRYVSQGDSYRIYDCCERELLLDHSNRNLADLLRRTNRVEELPDEQPEPKLKNRDDTGTSTGVEPPHGGLISSTEEHEMDDNASVASERSFSSSTSANGALDSDIPEEFHFKYMRKGKKNNSKEKAKYFTEEKKEFVPNSSSHNVTYNLYDENKVGDMFNVRFKKLVSRRVLNGFLSYENYELNKKMILREIYLNEGGMYDELYHKGEDSQRSSSGGTNPSGEITPTGEVIPSEEVIPPLGTSGTELYLHKNTLNYGNQEFTFSYKNSNFFYRYRNGFLAYYVSVPLKYIKQVEFFMVRDNHLAQSSPAECKQFYFTAKIDKTEEGKKAVEDESSEGVDVKEEPGTKENVEEVILNYHLDRTLLDFIKSNLKNEGSNIEEAIQKYELPLSSYTSSSNGQVNRLKEEMPDDYSDHHERQMEKRPKIESEVTTNLDGKSVHGALSDYVASVGAPSSKVDMGATNEDDKKGEANGEPHTGEIPPSSEANVSSNVEEEISRSVDLPIGKAPESALESKGDGIGSTLGKERKKEKCLKRRSGRRTIRTIHSGEREEDTKDVEQDNQSTNAAKFQYKCTAKHFKRHNTYRRHLNVGKSWDGVISTNKRYYELYKDTLQNQKLEPLFDMKALRMCIIQLGLITETSWRIFHHNNATFSTLQNHSRNYKKLIDFEYNHKNQDHYEDIDIEEVGVKDVMSLYETVELYPDFLQDWKCVEFVNREEIRRLRREDLFFVNRGYYARCKRERRRGGGAIDLGGVSVGTGASTGISSNALANALLNVVSNVVGNASPIVGQTNLHPTEEKKKKKKVRRKCDALNIKFWRNINTAIEMDKLHWILYNEILVHLFYKNINYVSCNNLIETLVRNFFLHKHELNIVKEKKISNLFNLQLWKNLYNVSFDYVYPYRFTDHNYKRFFNKIKNAHLLNKLAMVPLSVDVLRLFMHFFLNQLLHTPAEIQHFISISLSILSFQIMNEVFIREISKSYVRYIFSSFSPEQVRQNFENIAKYVCINLEEGTYPTKAGNTTCAYISESMLNHESCVNAPPSIKRNDDEKDDTEKFDDEEKIQYQMFHTFIFDHFVGEDIPNEQEGADSPNDQPSVNNSSGGAPIKGKEPPRRERDKWMDRINPMELFQEVKKLSYHFNQAEIKLLKDCIQQNDILAGCTHGKEENVEKSPEQARRKIGHTWEETQREDNHSDGLEKTKPDEANREKKKKLFILHETMKKLVQMNEFKRKTKKLMLLLCEMNDEYMKHMYFNGSMPINIFLSTNFTKYDQFFKEYYPFVYNRRRNSKWGSFHVLYENRLPHMRESKKGPLMKNKAVMKRDYNYLTSSSSGCGSGSGGATQMENESNQYTCKSPPGCTSSYKRDIFEEQEVQSKSLGSAAMSNSREGLLTAAKLHANRSTEYLEEPHLPNELNLFKYKLYNTANEEISDHYLTNGAEENSFDPKMKNHDFEFRHVNLVSQLRCKFEDVPYVNHLFYMYNVYQNLFSLRVIKRIHDMREKEAEILSEQFLLTRVGDDIADGVPAEVNFSDASFNSNESIHFSDKESTGEKCHKCEEEDRYDEGGVTADAITASFGVLNEILDVGELIKDMKKSKKRRRKIKKNKYADDLLVNFFHKSVKMVKGAKNQDGKEKKGLLTTLGGRKSSGGTSISSALGTFLQRDSKSASQVQNSREDGAENPPADVFVDPHDMKRVDISQMVQPDKGGIIQNAENMLNDRIDGYDSCGGDRPNGGSHTGCHAYSTSDTSDTSDSSFNSQGSLDFRSLHDENASSSDLDNTLFRRRIHEKNNPPDSFVDFMTRKKYASMKNKLKNCKMDFYKYKDVNKMLRYHMLLKANGLNRTFFYNIRRIYSYVYNLYDFIPLYLVQNILLHFHGGQKEARKYYHVGDTCGGSTHPEDGEYQFSKYTDAFFRTKRWKRKYAKHRDRINGYHAKGEGTGTSVVRTDYRGGHESRSSNPAEGKPTREEVYKDPSEGVPHFDSTQRETFGELPTDAPTDAPEEANRKGSEKDSNSTSYEVNKKIKTQHSSSGKSDSMTSLFGVGGKEDPQAARPHGGSSGVRSGVGSSSPSDCFSGASAKTRGSKRTGRRSFHAGDLNGEHLLSVKKIFYIFYHYLKSNHFIDGKNPCTKLYRRFLKNYIKSANVYLHFVAYMLFSIYDCNALAKKYLDYIHLHSDLGKYNIFLHMLNVNPQFDQIYTYPTMQLIFHPYFYQMYQMYKYLKIDAEPVLPHHFYENLDKFISSSSLFQPSRNYFTMIKRYFKSKCVNCSKSPTIILICLFCGSTICLQESDNVRIPLSESIGKCGYHTTICGGDQALYLCLNVSSVLFSSEHRFGLVSGPYVDKNGDVDPRLKRGKNLYLSPHKMNRIYEIIVNSAVDVEIYKQTQKSD
ncbi:Uncharacterized protein PCOAH_00053440 [Plasmodium coatneyi]|uniref:RING-type E3 ubiquitin transferase n=1 Tax=Plasmodium coatneyi TaxID=208452 RepID=A0A1B1E7P6_9APIC|nr:Uncharacterized protein PCOAH_00053440 [Plasmodium coatneyi]ANQ11025.1 Uncharacterized protein PCOAH_00053440 [Plasmodium coatneyi]